MEESLNRLLIILSTDDFVSLLGKEEQMTKLWVNNTFPLTGKYWVNIFILLNNLVKDKIDLANLFFYPKGAAYPGSDNIPPFIYLNDKKANGDISVLTLIHEIRHYLDYQKEEMSEVIDRDINNLYNAKVIGEVINVLSIILILIAIITGNESLLAICMGTPVFYYLFSRLKFYELSTTEMSVDSYYNDPSEIIDLLYEYLDLEA